MLTKLLIATNNNKKLTEINSLLEKYGIITSSLKQVNINMEVEETGKTFEENAILKASAYFKASGVPTLADDSGIEVDFLKGRPGVYSARYSGEGTTDETNIAKLLKELDGVPFEQRTARYRVVFALALPDKDILTFEGTVEGYITTTPRGLSGFGYDPIFYLPQFKLTAAEITQEQKNSISHRKVALEKMLEVIKNI